MMNRCAIETELGKIDVKLQSMATILTLFGERPKMQEQKGCAHSSPNGLKQLVQPFVTSENLLSYSG